MVADEPAAKQHVVSELQRVLKPEGHAVLMIRDDNLASWQPHLDAAECKAWRMVHATAPRNNFPRANHAEPIMYRIHVFQRLEQGA